jgi:hypothetical protein
MEWRAMIARLAFLAALLCAVPAVAQEAAPQPVPTAAQISTARAEADRIIAAASAGDSFENLTSSDTPLVRHKASGLTCVFNIDDPRDKIHFYPATEGGPPHGDDVGCASWWGSTFVSTIATRYPQQYSAPQLFATAISDIQRSWENVKAFEDSFQISTIRGQEEPLMAAFSAEREGRPRTTLVVLRNIGAWSFKVRATGEPDNPEVTTIGTLAFGLAIPGGWETYQAGF